MKHAQNPDASQSKLIIAKGTPLVPGKMYLRLYHGRNNPDEEMDDWGFTGPTFGPLSCYVQTYCRTFRMYAEGNTQEIWLETHDDMILWDKCYYGDFMIFLAGSEDNAS
jgi:hypothetical protein